MINKLFVLIIFEVLLLSCEKDCPCVLKEESITDRQVRLDFQFGSTVWNTKISTPGEILPEQYSLLRFNLYNYQIIDSVIFVAKIWSSQKDNECIVDLYNLTDNQVIPRSQIKTSSTDFQGLYIYSQDIKDNFPDKEIELGLRIKSQTEGVYVSIYRAHIFIYKN